MYTRSFDMDMVVVLSGMSLASNCCIIACTMYDTLIDVFVSVLLILEPVVLLMEVKMFAADLHGVVWYATVYVSTV